MAERRNRRSHALAIQGLNGLGFPLTDERRGDHDAVVPHLDKLAVQAITARPHFIVEMQSTSACGQFLNQLSNMIRPVRNRAPVADLAAALSARNRNRYRRFMDIQPDERATLHMVSPPFLRLGTGPSGATLECRMPWERPPSQSAQDAIMGV